MHLLLEVKHKLLDIFVLHYDTFELGKHCKQYHQKSLIKS